MPWPFCSSCGTILDPPESDTIKCSYCSYSCKFEDINESEIITRSPATQKPSWVADEDASEPAPTTKNHPKHATIEDPCPKCNYHELYFYTMQLRSVDEGSTVFYECPKCAHKFSQNN